MARRTVVFGLCSVCGKRFSPTHGNQKYCSKDCERKKNTGKYYLKNKQKIIKNSKEYTLETLEGINLYFWRNIVIPCVKNRDGFKCVDCSSTRNLEVHHKEVNVDCPTILDLITLCKSCHRKKHVKKK